MKGGKGVLGERQQNIIELISVIKKSINSDIAFTLLVDVHGVRNR